MTENLPAPQTVGGWHDSLIDFMRQNPTADTEAIAQNFDVSSYMIEVTVNSDLFKERLARRNESLEAGERATPANAELKAAAVVNIGLDTLATRLERGRNRPGELPTETVIDSVDKAMRMLGYGTHKRPAVAYSVDASQNNIVLQVNQDTLENARAKMRAVADKSKELAEADIVNGEYTLLSGPVGSAVSN